MSGTQEEKAQAGFLQTNVWAAVLICLIAYSVAVAVAIAADGLWGLRDPLWRTVAGTTVATVVVFVFSRLFNNSSIYDPYWSLQPLVLAVVWSMMMEQADLRFWIAVGLTYAWGLRLTYNGLARFHGLSYEDPRYIDLQKASGKLYFLTDLFGIQLFPTALVFAGSLPLYGLLLVGPAASLTLLDGLAIIITAGAIAIETIADYQLIRFKKSNTDPERVCTEGLWGRSRHPNYFGEMSFWWGLFVFAMAADPSLWWTGVGAVAITVLFFTFSIPDMNKRKAMKRSTYEDQTRGIPMLVPRLTPRPHADRP